MCRRRRHSSPSSSPPRFPEDSPLKRRTFIHTRALSYLSRSHALSFYLFIILFFRFSCKKKYLFPTFFKKEIKTICTICSTSSRRIIGQGGRRRRANSISVRSSELVTLPSFFFMLVFSFSLSLPPSRVCFILTLLFGFTIAILRCFENNVRK